MEGPLQSMVASSRGFSRQSASDVALSVKKTWPEHLETPWAEARKNMYLRLLNNIIIFTCILYIYIYIMNRFAASPEKGYP